MILIIFLFANTSFSQVFDIYDGSTTDNTGGANSKTVVETLSAITMTIRIQNSNIVNPDQTVYLDTARLGGVIGTTNGAVFHSISAETGTVSIKFSTAVNNTTSPLLNLNPYYEPNVLKLHKKYSLHHTQRNA